jgi:nucleotide-binding universal stress UspA family protein
VGRKVPQRTAYGVRDQPAPAADLVRRLLLDLAWRYQALPLDEARGRVPVSVANPEDVQVRDAIQAPLGPGSCVVQDSPLTREAPFSEVWGEMACGRPRLGVCAFAGSPDGELRRYAEVLRALLGGHLSSVTTTEEIGGQDADGPRAWDLVIFGQEGSSLVRRVLSLREAGGEASSSRSVMPFALLVAQEPRWPLGRILLILSGAEEDRSAVDWALRLACPSAADVTLLAIVPPVPAMYHGLSRMEQTSRSLLTTDTALGYQMREAARRLLASGVECSLRLRQGRPDLQIYREMVREDYDLAIMITKPCRWWLRQLKGDPICSLLKWARWPVLFVEPTNE